MDYTVVTIREVDDPSADDRLYPLIDSTRSPWPLELGPEDGEAAAHRATRLWLHRLEKGQAVSMLEMDDHKVDVIITDSRVMLHCANFDKGSSYAGVGAIGLMLAGTSALVSKTRAARRRRGRALVGQIRYSWLTDSLSSPRQKLIDFNQLRLTCQAHLDGRRTTYLLTLTFPGQISVDDLARDVALRAARHRLNDPTLSAAERAELLALGDAERPTRIPRKFTGYRLPGAHIVHAGPTARQEP